MTGRPRHQEPYRPLEVAMAAPPPPPVVVMAAARTVRCNKRDHSLQLPHHWQPWQENERPVNEPVRAQRWRNGASFAYQEESCLPCFNMAAMGTRIPAQTVTVKSATLRYTETRWPSLINRTILGWLLDPPCDQKVVS